jgi:hypothetical protein
MNFTHMNFKNSKFHTFFILKKLLTRKLRKNRLKQKMEENICQNQTPFKFLVYLETLFFAVFEKKCMKLPPIYPTPLKRFLRFCQGTVFMVLSCSEGMI